MAFTEWWFETLNYATATGDTAGLRAASDPGCDYCDNLLGRDRGGLRGWRASSTGGRVSVIASSPLAPSKSGASIVPVYRDVEADA